MLYRYTRFLLALYPCAMVRVAITTVAGFRGLWGVWRAERALEVVHRHADGARGHGRPVGTAWGALSARGSRWRRLEAEESAVRRLHPG